MSYHYVHIEDPETLTLQEGDDLSCATDEVVIDVAYAGINRADVLQRMGFYPPPPDASSRLVAADKNPCAGGRQHG